MKTELYLVRHGETKWNVEKRFQGQNDSPLTENGREQARSLGISLQGIQFDGILSSDLGRALETANLINSYLQIPVIETDPILRERNFGIFHGLDRTEAERMYPHEASQIWSGDPNVAIPGGESRAQVRKRAEQFLSEFPVKYSGKKILAVTHGGIINPILRIVLRIPFDEPRRFKLPNTGLSILEHNGEAWFVRAMNIFCPLNGNQVYDETV
jgi:probable phosphoglycerate mutase